MPRFNVEHNGKWACFSSISDAFITEFMEKSDYEQWKIKGYGSLNYEPLEKCNIKTMEEAVFSVSLNRNRDECIDSLSGIGLTEQKVNQLIYDCETKYYVPISDSDGYKCPNCGNNVLKDQPECNRDDCGNRLVWR